MDIVIVLNGQRHRQVLHKGCFSKKECKEKCSLYGRCQKCCIDLCMIFFHDPHCHFEEEPVSEELGDYINELSKQFPEVSFAKLSRIAVSVSRWQQNQDVKNKQPKVTNRTELDEYAYQCAYDMSNDWVIENPTWHDVEDACKLGANWQKKQDEHTIGKVRSILNKIAYRNNGLDVNGDYCEQPYVELDNEFRKLLKEE